MTTDMILTLGILILMIALIMSGKLAFGAPPLLACLLLVVTGQATVQEAFAGFINPTVIMIAGFMVIMAALQKTSLIEKVQSSMITLVNKGGYKSYTLLIIVVMLGTSLVGSGATGYYVLILSLVSTIPYNKKLPASKLMLPVGFATNHPLIPINVALQIGVTITVLETAGITEEFPMVNFIFLNAVVSLTFLAWSLIAYRFLPDQPIGEAIDDTEVTKKAKTKKMPAWKEYLILVAFVISVVGMMFMNELGNVAYVIPALAGAFVLLIGALDFKEVRDNMGAPVIIMIAGVIGVADALVNSGFTTMVGDYVASVVGSNVSPLIILLIFTLLTSTSATLTGSNIGSVYIFAPIAIAVFLSLGINPTSAAVAVVLSGWNGGYMPIDGMPAIIFGLGKYKLTQFWAFTIPMYFLRILALCIGVLLLFPM